MRIYDISVPIAPELPVYPGDPGATVTSVVAVGPGSNFALSQIVLGTHTGTHVDPPAHFFPEGATVDQLALDTLIGPALVVECDAPAVTAAFLESAALPLGAERVLFKTPNGALWDKPNFQRRFTYIEEDAAHWLVARGVRLVGIDYLSVEKYATREPRTHWALLGAGVVILEGIDLRGVPSGAYTLACLPLKLKGGDGAPARAVLMREE